MTVWIENSISLLEFIADKAMTPPIIYFVGLLVLSLIFTMFRGLLR